MASTAVRASTTIDVISDVVCPWCFIGRRRLGVALSAIAHDDPAFEPHVAWHPFQLNPDLPPGGIDRRAYLERKFGSAQATQIYENLRSAGRSVGIDFAFERITRQPNTLDAHRLIAWAQARGGGEDIVERLFRAYFLEGRLIGERETLAAIAGEAGLPVDEVRAHLASDDGAEAVAAMDRRVRELGVSGVPFFIFGGKVAVSGAQEPRVLVDAFAKSRATA